MKIGYRKRSFGKSFSAMTFGRATRSWKRLLIPGYGRKGINKIKNPGKYLHDKTYHSFTKGVPKTGLSKKK